MINKSHRKIIIAFIAFIVIGTGLYWRQPLAKATMKLLQVAQGVIRVRSSPNNGLVGYWNFDECDSCTTAADKSGGGNTGTMYNAAGQTIGDVHTPSGKIGNGISLDGSNDHIDAPDADSLDGFSKMTVMAWIKPTGSFGSNWWEKTIVSKYDFSLSQISWGLWDGTAQLTFAISTDGGTAGRIWITAGTIVTNVWQHVVGVYDGANLRVYINGAEVGSTSKTGNIYAGSAPLTIGDYHDNGNHAGYYFNGSIDDVRIYNRALSADEIVRLYEEGSFRTTINANQNSSFNSGLVGMWSFNGPDVDWASTTAEILDRSGNGLNGDALGITKNSVRTGIVGQALNFDGVDDYVGVSANASLSLGTSMTISIWFNRRSTTGLQTLASSNKYYAVGFNGNWIFRITDGTALAFASYDGQSNEQGGGFAFTINNNVWNHAVVSIDGATATVYLNGVASASGPLTHTKALIDAGVSGMSIGDDLNWVNVPFDGLIDDVRIYNRALNASEIQALYLSSARQ